MVWSLVQLRHLNHMYFKLVKDHSTSWFDWELFLPGPSLTGSTGFQLGDVATFATAMRIHLKYETCILQGTARTRVPLAN